MTKELENVDNILQLYSFKNELGEDIVWTPGQKEIMAPIINLGMEGKHYVQIETPTRYGKSSSIAAAILMRCTRKESWAIVAGTAEKAQIIMDYFVTYALDNEISRALLSTEIALDKLKQERSRRHLSFSTGFEVRVFSADSRNKQSTGNAIMGFGAPFVVLDEAALIDDVVESKVFRMIMGFSTTKHLYLKVGNPFYRNHFLKSHNDPDFHVIHFDYKRGIAEGRFRYEDLEKARQKPGFSILYDVKFPEAGAVDDKGWSSLLTEEEIESVMVAGGSGYGFLKVGVDPAGEGANFNTIVVRYRNYAKVMLKEQILDQFIMTEKLVEFKNQVKRTEGILPLGYFVDRVGVGEGYYQTMRVDLENVMGVNVGRKPLQENDFINIRAEAYWRLSEAIKTKKVKLERNDDWLQLANIKYKIKLEGGKGRIQIMSKDEMLRNGIQSPDVADALMLTYVTLDPMFTTVVDVVEEEKEYDRYAAFNELP